MIALTFKMSQDWSEGFHCWDTEASILNLKIRSCNRVGIVKTYFMQSMIADYLRLNIRGQMLAMQISLRRYKGLAYIMR